MTSLNKLFDFNSGISKIINKNIKSLSSFELLNIKHEKNKIKFNKLNTNKIDIKKVIEEKYLYNSLYFISHKNKFRILLIKIIENASFNLILIIITYINALMTFFYTYKIRLCFLYLQFEDKNECLIKYKKDINFDNILDKINIIFNILFSIEIFIKIIASGLLFNKNSFLRNGWNVIDFIIVIYQWIKINHKNWGNLSIFRCLKLLNNLKNLKFLRRIKLLINSVIVSLPTLGKVILFLMFIFLIFGILGMQLFSGIFYNRCREKPILISNKVYKNKIIPYYISKPVSERICSPNNYSGTFKCPSNSFCVNYYNIIDYFNMTNITMNSFEIKDEKLKNNEWLYYGVFNFDNIINCLINSFTFMTLQNWADDLTKLLDGNYYITTIIYFVAIVVIGGFFIIKLILAAQNDAFKKVINDERELKLKQLLSVENKNDFLNFSKNEIKNFIDLDQKDLSPILKKKETIHSLHYKNIDKTFFSAASVSNFKYDNNKNKEDEKNVNDNNNDNNNMNINSYFKDSKSNSNLIVNNNNNNINSVRKKPIKKYNTKKSIKEITNFKMQKIFKLKRFQDSEDKFFTSDKNSIKNEVKKESSLFNIENNNNNNNNPNYIDCSHNINFSFEENNNNKNNNNNNNIHHSINKNILIINNKIYYHNKKNLKKFLIKNKFKHPDHFLSEYFKIIIPKKNSNIISKIIIKSKYNKLKQKFYNILKYFIIKEYPHHKRYFIFNLIIYITITINIIFLCFIKYPISKTNLNIIDKINIISSFILILELLIKFFVLGFSKFFEEHINKVYVVILILGLIEIIYCKFLGDSFYYSNASLSSLRMIRYLKLFKYAKEGGFIRKFVDFFLLSMRDLLYYCILLFFFILIFAIAGRELFANSVYIIKEKDEYNMFYLEKKSPRENFDSVLNSLVTVFIFFIGDNWPEIMYEYSKLYLTRSEIYFIGTNVIGNIMSLNLFLSILMSNYETDDRINLFVKQNKRNSNNIVFKSENKFKMIIKLIKKYFEDFLNCCIKPEKIINTNIRRRRKNMIGTDIIFGKNFVKQIQEFKNYIKIERSSLNIFNSNNKFRILCSNILQKNKIFINIVYYNTILSLIILAWDSPILEFKQKRIIFIFDIIITFIFFIEILLKIISFGFLFNGENSYLRYEYNFLDFISFIISLIYILTNFKMYLEKETNVRINKYNNVIKIIKLLRLFRIFKLIESSESLKAALRAFLKSLKQMIKILVFSMFFILIFDIIGVTYFRGKFNRCDFLNVPKSHQILVKTKWDCMDYGGNWITPYPNLNNIFSGYVLFFEMMTTENWTKYLYLGIDSININIQPQYNHAKYRGLFFILYMIFAFFFLLNLAIAILSDNFNKEKEKIENNKFKKPVQNEYLKIFKSLFKEKIPKKRIRVDKIRKVLITILDSIYFEVVITVCIITNLFVLCMNSPSRSKTTENFVSNMNKILSYVFIIEGCLKIYVYELTYFKNGWNIIDFIVVVESIITLTLSKYIKVLNNDLETALFKVLRMGRVLRLLKTTNVLQRIFNLFINSIPSVFNVLILYFLTLFIYAIIGMTMFYNLKYQDIISEKWNFRNFFNSFLILIRVTSGEGWNTILHESINERDGFFDCKYDNEMTIYEKYKENIGCGTIFGFPYYISFVILSTMMFLEFFSAVISSAMNDTYAMNLEELKISEINKFKKKWIKFDKEGSGFIKYNKLNKFLYSIGHPLGITSLKIKDFMSITSLLNIYTYSYKKEHYVFFYDVLIELTKYYLLNKFIEEEFNKEKLLNNNIEEIIENKTEAFINYMSSINDMQNDHFYQIYNPYNLEKKYKKYVQDEYIRGGIFKTKKLTVNMTWAIMKLSSFVKCYKSMKKKTIKAIENDEYKNDLAEYVILYQKRIEDEDNPNYFKEECIDQDNYIGKEFYEKNYGYQGVSNLDSEINNNNNNEEKKKNSNKSNKRIKYKLNNDD